MYSASVIVPTLNEAGNIDFLLKRLFRVKSSCSLDFDVLFADSASTDATCEMIARWQNREDVSLLKCQAGCSLAEAVRAAADMASAEFLVIMDADLSHPPEILPELIKPLVDDSCDMVIGSRYIAGGSTPDWSFVRKISSWFATIPARLFTNVKDPLAGFFAVKRSSLQDLTDSVCGFKIGLEILVAGGRKLRVKEVPIEFRDRRYGVSKMNGVVALHYIKQILTLVNTRGSKEL